MNAAECRNCGTALAGRYCSACGQAADVRIPSFGGLVADALGDLYSFDSRLWRSLVTLALKPGRMTSLYLEGQRARFTPPFRMYVVTSLVFFVAFSLVRSMNPPNVASAAAAAASDIAAPPSATGTAPEPTAAATTEAEGVHITLEGGEWSCNLVDQDVPVRLRQRLVAACAELEGDNTSFARALRDNVPVMMLVFIPIVAAITRVLYLFAHRKYVEHLLFFLHVHTLFFLTATVTLLLSLLLPVAPVVEWPARILIYAAWLYFPVYLYLAMRYVYRQGHALTATKYIVLGASYGVAFMFTLLSTIAITAVTL